MTDQEKAARMQAEMEERIRLEHWGSGQSLMPARSWEKRLRTRWRSASCRCRMG